MSKIRPVASIRASSSDHAAPEVLDLEAHRLIDVLPMVESHDAALPVGAECSQVLEGSHADAVATRDRLIVQARALGYAPLVTLLRGERVRPALQLVKTHRAA